MPRALDRLDRRILEELQADARISNQELAKRVGLSPAPCWRRLRRLEEAEYIAGYATLLAGALAAVGAREPERGSRQPHVRVPPRHLELARRARRLGRSALRPERRAQALERPAVAGIPPQIVPVDLLRARRVAAPEQLRAEQMTRREEPVGRLVVGEPILGRHRILEQPARLRAPPLRGGDARRHDRPRDVEDGVERVESGGGIGGSRGRKALELSRCSPRLLDPTASRESHAAPEEIPRREPRRARIGG